MAEDTAPEVKRFHYPPVAEFTGRMQYAIDRMGVAKINSGDKDYGEVRRGGVVEMKRGLAERLVTRGSDYTHVAADTPLGQPAEYVPKPKGKSAAPAPIPEPEEMLSNPKEEE